MERSSVLQEPPLFHQNAGHFRNYYLKNQALGDDKFVKKKSQHQYRRPTVSEITDFYLKKSNGMSSLQDLYKNPTTTIKEEKMELENVTNELQQTYQQIMQTLLNQATLTSSKGGANHPLRPTPPNKTNIKITQSLELNEALGSDPRSQNTYSQSKPHFTQSQHEAQIDRKTKNGELTDQLKETSLVSSKNDLLDYKKSMHQNLINISSNLSMMLQESCAGIDNICQKVRLCLLDASVSYEFNKTRLESCTRSLPTIDFQNSRKNLNTIFEMPVANINQDISEISVIIEKQINENEIEQYKEAHKKEIEKELDKKPHKETPEEKIKKSSKTITPFFTILKVKSSKSLKKYSNFSKYLTESIKEIEKIKSFDSFLNIMVDDINSEIEKCYLECPGVSKSNQKKEDKNKEISKKKENTNTNSKKEKNDKADNDNNDNKEAPVQELLQNEDHLSEQDLSGNWSEQRKQRRNAMAYSPKFFSIPDVYRKRAFTNLNKKMNIQVEANDSFIFFQKLMKKSKQNTEGEKKNKPVTKSRPSSEKSEKRLQTTNELLDKYKDSLWFKKMKKPKKLKNQEHNVLRIRSRHSKNWYNLLPQCYSEKSSTISLRQNSSKKRKGNINKENKHVIRSTISLSRKDSKVSKGSVNNIPYRLQVTTNRPFSEPERCRLSWMKIKHSQMTKKNLKYMDILDDISKNDLVPLRAEYPRRNEEVQQKSSIKNSLLYKLIHNKTKAYEDAWSILLLSSADSKLCESDSTTEITGEIDNPIESKTLNKQCTNLIDAVSPTILPQLEIKKSKEDKPKQLFASRVFLHPKDTNIQIKNNHFSDKRKTTDIYNHLEHKSHNLYKNDTWKVKRPVSPTKENIKKFNGNANDDVAKKVSKFIFSSDKEIFKNDCQKEIDFSSNQNIKEGNGKTHENVARKLSKYIFSSNEDIIKHQSQAVYIVMPAHVIYANPPLLRLKKNKEPLTTMLPLQPMKEAKELLKRGEWMDETKKAPKPMKVFYDPAVKKSRKEEPLSARQISNTSNIQTKIAQINSWSPKNFSRYCPPIVQLSPKSKKNLSAKQNIHPHTSKTDNLSPEMFEIYKKTSDAISCITKSSARRQSARNKEVLVSKDEMSSGVLSNRPPSPPSFMFDMDLIPKKDSKIDAHAKQELDKILQEDSFIRSKSPKEKKIWERKFGKTTGQKLISFIENQPDKYEIPTPKHAQPKILAISSPTSSKISKQQEMLNQLKNLTTKNCNVQMNIEKAISVIEDKMVDILSKSELSHSIDAFDEIEKEITHALNSMKTKTNKMCIKHELITEPTKEEEEDVADQLIKRLEKILDTSSMSSLKEEKNKKEKSPRKHKSNFTKKSKPWKSKVLGSFSTSDEKIFTTSALSPKSRKKSSPIKDKLFKDDTKRYGKSMPGSPKIRVAATNNYKANKDLPIATQQNQILLQTNQNIDISTTEVPNIAIQTPKTIYQCSNRPNETIVNMAIIDRASPKDLSPGGDQASAEKSLEDDDKTISNSVTGDQGDQTVPEKEITFTGDEEVIKKDVKNIGIKENEHELVLQKEVNETQQSIQENKPLEIAFLSKEQKSPNDAFIWSRPVINTHNKIDNPVKEEILKLLASETVSEVEINKIGKIQQEINNCISNLEESMVAGEKIVEETSLNYANNLETRNEIRTNIKPFETNTLEDSEAIDSNEHLNKIMDTAEEPTLRPTIVAESEQILKEIDEITDKSTPSFYDHVNKIILRVEDVYSQLEEFEDELESDIAESSKHSFHPSAIRKSNISIFNENQQNIEDKNNIVKASNAQANNHSRPETPKTPKIKCQRSSSFYNVLNFLDTLTDIKNSYTIMDIRTVR